MSLPPSLLYGTINTERMRCETGPHWYRRSLLACGQEWLAPLSGGTLVPSGAAALVDTHSSAVYTHPRLGGHTAFCLQNVYSSRPH